MEVDSCIKSLESVWFWCVIPIILATWEADIGRITV
jgi:hypothetical protein